MMMCYNVATRWARSWGLQYLRRRWKLSTVLDTPQWGCRSSSAPPA
jgi:hypothetical protein